MATNPNTSDTKLLIPMNVDPFADISVGGDGGGQHGNGTKNGTAALDTTIINPFGTTGCLLLDGNSDFLSFSDHADFAFGANPLEISGYVRVSDFQAPNDAGFLSIRSNPRDDQNFISIYFNSNYIIVQIWSGGAAAVYFASDFISLSVDIWYYIGIHRGWGGNANDWAITLDGIAVGTTTDATALPDCDGDVEIGIAQDASATPTVKYLKGYMSSFRIVKGVCPRTANFDPPPIQYPDTNRWCGQVSSVANPTKVAGIAGTGFSKVNGVITIE